MSYKKSICSLRWGYPNISLTRSEIRTCCKTPFQTVSENDIKEYGINLFLNTKYQKERRLEMLKGIRHHSCSQCWQIEDQGASSLRLANPNPEKSFDNYARHNKMYSEYGNLSLENIAESATLESAIVESHRPFMLEVSLGNTCDMKCMYCNHVYSSQWATEGLKNKTLSIQDYKSVTTKPEEKFTELFWKWVDLEAKHSLDRIGIIGGEPLITPEFYDFADKLLEVYKDVPHNNTNIWIVTNMNSESKYFDKFIQYIPKLNEKFKLEIHISMESTHEQAEYIRNGLSWSTFENNVNRLFDLTKDMDRVTLAFLPSITALSVPRFKNFLVWVYELSKKYNKIPMLKQNIVTWPQPHTPFILPSEFATYLDSAIEWLSTIQDNTPKFSDEFGRWGVYNTFLKNLRNSIRNGGQGKTELRSKFFNWFNDFDKLRNLNFKQTFPELVDFYNLCEKHKNA
jgi:organic radical activating enzyme